MLQKAPPEVIQLPPRAAGIRTAAEGAEPAWPLLAGVHGPALPPGVPVPSAAALRPVLATMIGLPVPMVLVEADGERAAWPNRAFLRLLAVSSRDHAAPSDPALAAFRASAAPLVAEGLAGRPWFQRGVEVDLGWPAGPGAPPTARLDLQGSPIPGEDGRAAGVLIVAGPAPTADGREGPEAEPVPRAEDRLDLALDAAGILGTIVTDLRTGTVVADARFARTFHLDPEGCRLGLPAAVLHDAIPPEDREAVAAARAEAVRRGGAFAHRYRMRLPDGRTPWVEIKGAVEADAEGRPSLILGVLQDVSAQVAAEEALRAAEARAAEAAEDLRATLDAIPMAVWIARDAAGRQIEGNRTGRELLRIAAPDTNLSKSGEAAGSRLAHFRVLAPDGGEIAPEDLPLQRAARGETVREFEERLVFDDGEERWLLGHAVPLLDAEGRPRGAVGAFADVTVHRRAEAALAERESFLRAVLQSQPECIKVCDLDGRLRTMNPAGLAMLDVEDVEAILGREVIGFVDEGDRATFAAAQAGAVLGRASGWVQFRVTGAKGRRLRMEGLATPLRDPAGAVVAVLWTTRDVTEQHAMEAALRESEARFRNMADHSPAIMWVADPEGRCTYLNRTWHEVTGRAAADSAGYDRAAAIHPDDLAAVERAFLAARERRLAFRVEYRIWTRSGGWRWVLDAAAPRWGSGGAFLGFVGSMVDIDDRKAAEATLERERRAAEVAASHDALTGLLCRAGFHAELEAELAQPRSEPSTALLLIDLDEFKSVNDALGHPVGDALLREVANRLRASVPPSGLLGRLGGDEFVVLLRDAGDAAEAQAVARRIIASLREPFLLDGHEVQVGASIGAALASDPGLCADDVFKRADIALYAAKGAGRGVVRHFAPSLEAAAVERQRLRTDLRGAAARGELHLVYQPIVDLDSSRVLGFEALLRWQHPERGPIAPAEFVPLAEEMGEIEAIGAWVLHRACQDAAAWPGAPRVSVNLSPRQFRGPALLDTVRDALRAAGLAGGRLQVEITESAMLDDDERVRSTLAGLHALGVRLAIDDFGTGYSSLGYLRRLAVDVIKIDQSFVVGLRDDPRSQAILRAVIGLGRGLGLALVAEGVETPEQADLLRAMGCHQGQGHVFSPPVPVAEVARVLVGPAAPGPAAALPA